MVLAVLAITAPMVTLALLILLFPARTRAAAKFALACGAVGMLAGAVGLWSWIEKQSGIGAFLQNVAHVAGSFTLAVLIGLAIRELRRPSSSLPP